MLKMVKNDVSFIISFVILMAKMWIFGFSPEVCPTELCNLVFSLKYLVLNGRQVLLGDITLGVSAIATPYIYSPGPPPRSHP